LPYGWGTGGIQVTASIIGTGDVLKVIDQGSDDTVNAVNIRRFFQRTTGVACHHGHDSGQHHPDPATAFPETPLHEGQILVYQVPVPEPMQHLEPLEVETRKHARSAGVRSDARQPLRRLGAFRPDRHHLRLPRAGQWPLHHGAVSPSPSSTTPRCT
jgi:hypothetical protein